MKKLRLFSVIMLMLLGIGIISGCRNRNNVLDEAEVSSNDEKDSEPKQYASWKIEGDTLIIYGNGDMEDYEQIEDENGTRITTPWYEHNNEIMNIVVENGVTSIGNYAFTYSKVNTIELPESIKKIGDKAFHGSWITEIKLPEGLESIGAYSFSSCFLPEIELPKSLKYVGEGAFGNIPKVTSNSSNYVVKGNALYDKDETILLWVDRSAKEITLPSTLEIIGDNTFNESKIIEIVFPDSVKIIGKNTFYGCQNLREVTLSKKLESIGDFAFLNCIYIRSITIPKSVKNIGEYAFNKVDKFIVTEGSYAESWAKEQGYNYTYK
ncbi:MAG: leucine-rich repeat domain-containing protein [Lachnospiraceae bacterium]|nr:leucine-rich repeat domain-containing protein [Lachnospiraceae bacterium]